MCRILRSHHSGPVSSCASGVVRSDSGGTRSGVLRGVTRRTNRMLVTSGGSRGLICRSISLVFRALLLLTCGNVSLSSIFSRFREEEGWLFLFAANKGVFSAFTRGEFLLGRLIGGSLASGCGSSVLNVL